MCLVIKQLLFSIQELRYVSITCFHCRTQITLDMANFDRPTSDTDRETRRKTFTPRSCPACKNDFDTALQSLDSFQAAYQQLSKLEGVVGFRAETG